MLDRSRNPDHYTQADLAKMLGSPPQTARTAKTTKDEHLMSTSGDMRTLLMPKSTNALKESEVIRERGNYLE